MSAVRPHSCSAVVWTTHATSMPPWSQYSASRRRRRPAGQRSETSGISCGFGTSYPQPPQGSRELPGARGS
eukprot:5252794-Pyramimonas_sp.AAC.1